MCLLALALVCVSACERKDQQRTGETKTTSGEAEQPRAEGEHAAEPIPGPVPTTQYQQDTAKKREAATTAEAEQAKAAKEKEESAAKAEAAKKGVTAKKPVPAKKKAATEKKPAKPEEEEEIVGTTTITAVEIETVPPKGTPTPPSETPDTRATPPGGMPLPSDAAKEPYVNHSTVLGDGTSGMYTDGQGTYGGRATWGTGASIPVNAPGVK
ncbi:MAG TPA: hypothetical protein VM925_17725 [Labilithrix sp.]|nr:hypothetical protein [Labilithrix sp.]